MLNIINTIKKPRGLTREYVGLVVIVFLLSRDWYWRDMWEGAPTARYEIETHCQAYLWECTLKLLNGYIITDVTEMGVRPPSILL